MISPSEYTATVDDITRQVMDNCGQPDHGLLLHLDTVGPVRVYRGDGTLLVHAGDRRGDSQVPAMLDRERATELRDFLTEWLDTQ